MKYIFLVGAPGSKWSSICKNIYFSPNINRTDYSDDRTYYHDASGELQLMHLGAYFDPGMEFGDFFDQLNKHSKKECEAEFDRPFVGNELKIIKSHVFAHHIDFLKNNWPDCPIVLVHRTDDSCLGWWVKCGHFDITYPLYNQYYKNLRNMSYIIRDQNKDILDAWERYSGTEVNNNYELCNILSIERPKEYQQNYASNDIKVKVI